MQTNGRVIDRLFAAIVRPEPLWEEEVQRATSWQRLLRGTVVPIVVVVAVVTGAATMVFGYHVPMLGVVRPALSDTVMQIVGIVVMYLVSILIMGWLAAWLAGLFGGKNDLDRGVAMLFWVSVPSLLGQMLSTLPMIGWIFGLGLGIYALVLLYRAIPVFMEVPLQGRVKHFILFLIASMAVSVVLGSTLGQLFAPHSVTRRIQERMPTPSVHPTASHKEEAKSPDQIVKDYVDSMTKGDYAQDVVEESAKDTFIPPKNGLLSEAQVQRFVALAKKVKQVRVEMADALKKKYENRDKEGGIASIGDLFNGLKDLSGMATLEMKVVKSNGGNWAEYQWVKDKVREAYYTPSLSATTEHNAKLIAPYKEILASVL